MHEIYVLLGEWIHWDTVVPEYTFNPTAGLEYASILVPNIDNVRTDFLIHTVAKEGEVRLKNISCIKK